jgi:cytochrome b561
MFDYQFINLHKQFGLTILVLVLLRIVWNLLSNYPSSASELGLLAKSISRLGHLFLYILMLFIPIFGIILVQSKGYTLTLWGLITIPNLIDIKPHDISHKIKEIHEYLAHSIIILAFIHALFALKHHYINGDSVLRRMLPKNKYRL